MDTARAQRSGIELMLAVVTHVGAVYWLQMGVRTQRTVSEQRQWQGELFFISVEPEDRRPTSPTTPASRADRLTTNPVQVEVADTGPSIDWSAQGGAAANAIVARQNAEAAMRSLDSKPKAIELPREDLRRREGTTQRFDDGEMITWISERCYVTNRPLVGPQLIEDRPNVVCKDPSKPRDDLFDRFRPKYLGGPKKSKRDELVDEDECPTLCQ